MKAIYLTLFLIIVGTDVLANEAKDLLQRSDRARGGLNQGLTWILHIQTDQGGMKQESKYEIKAKGDKILAICTFPPRQKGETFLFNDRNLWVYRSNLRKPISVSTRMRLSGQTANGDIASTHYSRDYDPTVLGKENLKEKKTVKLLLKAKFKDLTYDQINYWIEESSGLALQAEFLTPEGKPLKLATFVYDNVVKIDGKDIPFVSEMNISDSVFPSNKSGLKYESVKPQAFNESTFNVNNLAR